MCVLIRANRSVAAVDYNELMVALRLKPDQITDPQETSSGLGQTGPHLNAWRETSQNRQEAVSHI